MAAPSCSLDATEPPRTLSNATNISSFVDFDADDDPTDPLNWPNRYKWCMVIIISALSLIVNLAILLCAPATSYILEEFHSTSKLEGTLLVSIWELGEVIGPLIVAPLTEIYGRLPVYHTANVLFIIFSIAAAKSTSMGTLIAMRFLLGLSVASTVINPCIVGDMFREEHRGRALSTMGMIPFIAPVLGPTIGGFVSQAMGWRWTFWLIAIIAGPLQLVLFATYRETYRPRILELKAAKLRKTTGNPYLRSRYESKDASPSVILGRIMIRPLKLLVCSPVLLVVGLCGAIGMSLAYSIITSLPDVYENQYHFNKGSIGLTYFGLGIGMILSTLTVGHFMDCYLVHRAKSGKSSSESRLPPMILGCALVALGILSFGWAVRYHLHWIVPIIFSGLVGYGYVSIAISAWSYVVDAFGIYTASATAGTVLLRNAGAASLPLAGPSLVGKVGWGWGFSVLALLGLLTVPITAGLMITGGRIRSSKFHRKLIVS
ncbi:polyamine transporter 1 [Delitschia confertaspora ATCC 74209]|uniref:Polyamine transporter 1 n=1 Tax=Delitschia confertaspora ATCC 74209 TaxID=1513339 RepID=A0A9P4JWV4_9PLEO|nr:polyamine transporter 1 [Delitschia confertaspora ATCC 74209]